MAQDIRGKKWLFLAICLMQFSGNFANSLQGVLLSEYIDFYRLRSAGQGSMGSAQSAGCILACVGILILAGRIKRQHLLTCSGMLLSLSVLMIGVKPVFPVLLFLYLILGVGFAAISNLTSSMSASLYPGSASAMGMAHAFFGAGGLIAPLLLRRVLQVRPWNQVALLDGMIVLAVLFFYMLTITRTKTVLRDMPESMERVSFRGIGQFFRQKRNLLLLAAVFGYQAFQNGVAVWMIRYAERELSGAVNGAVLLSVFWIGTTAARLLTTRLHVSPARLYGFGCIVSGLAVMAAVFTNSSPAMLGAMIVAGLASGACVPLGYHLVCVWNTGNSLLPTSICSFAMFISMLVTSPVTAAVAANGVKYGMLAVSLYVLAGGCILLPLIFSKTPPKDF